MKRFVRNYALAVREFFNPSVCMSNQGLKILLRPFFVVLIMWMLYQAVTDGQWLALIAMSVLCAIAYWLPEIIRGIDKILTKMDGMEP